MSVATQAGGQLMTGAPAAPQEPAAPSLMSSMRAPVLLGGAIVVAFFLVLGGWAGVAPLSAGAVAPGIVSPDSNRKVIQHLEGGIIRTVHVTEGQEVEAGQALITLESTRAQASFSSREKQWLRLLIVQARLDAQARLLKELVLPKPMEGVNDPELLDFLATQQELFEIRLTTQLQQEGIFERQVDQLNSQISSLRAQSDGMARQIELISEELVDKQSLLDQQLIARSSVLELQREQARLESAIQANNSDIARAQQQIEEVRLSLLQAREKYRDEVAEERTRTNNELSQIDEEIVASGDILRRTEIVSPVDGIVLNFQNQTPGGVIRPGEAIMDVVPLDDDLVVLARVQPRDVDVVRVGLEAQVTLVPFANRNALPLSGEVIQVAADSTLDEATNQYYYETRVRIDVAELAKHDGYYLSPGMPADVTIVTGERTMLQYLIDPFVRSVQKAFVYD